jgi:hypothetical protein
MINGRQAWEQIVWKTIFDYNIDTQFFDFQLLGVVQIKSVGIAVNYDFTMIF